MQNRNHTLKLVEIKSHSISYKVFYLVLVLVMIDFGPFRRLVLVIVIGSFRLILFFAMIIMRLKVRKNTVGKMSIKHCSTISILRISPNTNK